MNRRKENPTDVSLTQLARGWKLSPATISREMRELPVTITQKGSKVKTIPVEQVGLIAKELMENDILKKHQQ